jgi:hypothetical protein
MTKEIDLIFTCDKYKSRSSIELVGVFTNLEKRDEAIRTLLDNNEAEIINQDDFKDKLSTYKLNILFKDLYFATVEENEFDDGSRII